MNYVYVVMNDCTPVMAFNKLYKALEFAWELMINTFHHEEIANLMNCAISENPPIRLKEKFFNTRGLYDYYWVAVIDFVN